MAYYSAVDADGVPWLRASVHDPASDEWHTVFGRVGDAASEWWDSRTAGLRHLYSPSWCAGFLFGIVAERQGAPRCFAPGADGRPTDAVEQRWEAIDRFEVVEDVTVVESDGSFSAFASVGQSAWSLELHRWHSTDGRDWEYAGHALSSPVAGDRFTLANNPSVTRVEDGWRMYFRTGTRPALGNHIRSAVSSDLLTWRHDEGVRVMPGGRWASHGVGFPTVWKTADGLWRMLYAGYWGDVDAAAAVARHWSAIGDGVR
jgi:hypothetical protein